MRIVYVLLSPTHGMHQYTGDLAAQLLGAGHDVHVVSTAVAYSLRDRYPAGVAFHTPVIQRSTGFALEGLDWPSFRLVHQCIVSLQPHLVHFSGVHLWNPLLILSLRRSGLPVVHTIHDLDPHPDVAHGSLIRLWNHAVIAATDGIVVHGECYRRRLFTAGKPAAKVLATPLLHSFLTAAEHECLVSHMPEPVFEPWTLFFGRFERYKGLEVLLTAQRLLAQQAPSVAMVLAGSGDLAAIWPHALPPGVTVYNRRIDSAEGSMLFRRCGVLVLPYTGATQSALPATAYAFGKPVIVAASGALPEVVQSGTTGWVVPAGDAETLANSLSTAFSNSDYLRSAGAAGRHWYEQERSRQQRDLVQFYNNIVAA